MKETLFSDGHSFLFPSDGFWCFGWLIWEWICHIVKTKCKRQPVMTKENWRWTFLILRIYTYNTHKYRAYRPYESMFNQKELRDQIILNMVIWTGELGKHRAQEHDYACETKISTWNVYTRSICYSEFCMISS